MSYWLQEKQSLVMTPQLQQAIKLLQMSNLELSQHLQEQMYDNPFLEVTGATETKLSETAKHSAPSRERSRTVRPSGPVAIQDCSTTEFTRSRFCSNCSGPAASQSWQVTRTERMSSLATGRTADWEPYAAREPEPRRTVFWLTATTAFCSETSRRGSPTETSARESSSLSKPELPRFLTNPVLKSCSSSPRRSKVNAAAESRYDWMRPLESPSKT